MTTTTLFFTGGGSAGHVTPNIAIINALKKEPYWCIHYIGTKTGIESQLIPPMDIPYHTISTGKLRRYFSWQNFIDPFKLIAGIVKSTYLCYKFKPKLIFSKGGFVALPVVIAGWITRTPVILHESDATPGLANRLSAPFAKKICLTTEETAAYFKKKNRLVVTGTPIREELLKGDADRGLKFTKLTKDKKTILVICGSLGSALINEAIRSALPTLLKEYNVIHICGKNRKDPSLEHLETYRQYEYIQKELADVFAASDLVISRSGANSLYELFLLKKLALLIPLSKKASRGDQIDNAKLAAKKGLADVLFEEELDTGRLLERIQYCFQNETVFKKNLDELSLGDSVGLITKLIKETVTPT